LTFFGAKIGEKGRKRKRRKRKSESKSKKEDDEGKPEPFGSEERRTTRSLIDLS